nr:hypothetical protein [Pseudomonas sp. P818]
MNEQMKSSVTAALAMQILDDLANRTPLRRMDSLCEQQKQVGSAKLAEHLERAGDQIAGYAYSLRRHFDALRAEAEALRAENGRLKREAKNDAIAYKAVIERQNQLREERDSFQREGIRAMEELEAARGLLREVELLAEAREHGYAERKHGDVLNYRCANAVVEMLPRIQDFLTATPQPGPDLRGLASFAMELIDGAWKGGSFDGGDIQEAGVRHGLLMVEQREESCGEHCDCAEYGFPAECYRLTPALAAHRQAQRKGDSNEAEQEATR